MVDFNKHLNKNAVPPPGTEPESTETPALPTHEDLEALAADLLYRVGLILKSLADIGMPLYDPDADAKNLLALQLMSVVIPMAMGADPLANVKDLVGIAGNMNMTAVRALLAVDAPKIMEGPK